MIFFPKERRSPKAISGRKQYSTIIPGQHDGREQAIQEVAVHPETVNSTVNIYFRYNQHSRYIYYHSEGNTGGRAKEEG
ncbi:MULTISPECIES: hypothetical protein [unclassified Bacteroides]|jgi:hypothetical protein|uniref:hypothetical protein n=1 Tax=unclassified Bacteroides TaxID=2646097 RepID=UPI000EFF7B48|nr:MULTISPECIES: hypothetical protein [unclassified Bacteroides]